MKKLSVIILSILCLTLVTVPAFADEPQDVVYDYTSSWQSTDLCGGSSSYTCTDYKYLVISSSIPLTGTNRQVAFYFYTNLGQQANFSYNTSSEIKVKINDNITRVQSWLISGLSSDESFTVTLTASDNCPACPTCPTCPDPNEPTIVRMFKDGFWAIATAFVSLIVPVLALFLVFRLVHDFFWGRG